MAHTGQHHVECRHRAPAHVAQRYRQGLHAEFGPGALLAYGEVIADLLDGDPSLSVRGDTAEECWRIVDPVIAAWRRSDVPIDDYEAGSEGPASWPAIP